MQRDVVVIGASAGGVEALRTVMRELPADLPAAVLVVLHVSAYGASVLPSILDRSGPLPVRHACSGERLTAGEVIVAPPDHHLMMHNGLVRLTRGPRENGHRPSVDVLFRSVAREAGVRAIGVVLSGVLDDGTAGLTAIRERGGLVVVQSPEDALYPGMPRSAIEHVPTDHVVRADEIGELLTELCGIEITATESQRSPLIEAETALALMDGDEMNEPDRPGAPSGYSCPDCAGTLFEIHDGKLVRFRCRVGHAWSAEALLGEQSQQLDSALWMALRSLEEKAALARELGLRATERGSELSARRFCEQAAEAHNAASLVRSMLEAHLLPVRTDDSSTGGT